MTAAALTALDLLALWLIAGLLVARCCGLNRLEDDKPHHPHGGRADAGITTRR